MNKHLVLSVSVISILFTQTIFANDLKRSAKGSEAIKASSIQNQRKVNNLSKSMYDLIISEEYTEILKDDGAQVTYKNKDGEIKTKYLFEETGSAHPLKAELGEKTIVYANRASKNIRPIDIEATQAQHARVLKQAQLVIKPRAGRMIIGTLKGVTAFSVLGMAAIAGNDYIDKKIEDVGKNSNTSKILDSTARQDRIEKQLNEAEQGKPRTDGGQQ